MDEKAFVSVESVGELLKPLSQKIKAQDAKIKELREQVNELTRAFNTLSELTLVQMSILGELEHRVDMLERRKK